MKIKSLHTHIIIALMIVGSGNQSSAYGKTIGELLSSSTVSERQRGELLNNYGLIYAGASLQRKCGYLRYSQHREFMNREQIIREKVIEKTDIPSVEDVEKGMKEAVTDIECNLDAHKLINENLTRATKMQTDLFPANVKNNSGVMALTIDERYKQILQDSQKGMSVNYTEMRKIFSESKYYTTSDTSKNSIATAKQFMDTKRPQEAIIVLHAALDADWMLIKPHFALMMIEKSLGHENEYEKHKDFIKSMMLSITGSTDSRKTTGVTDGKTTGTAWSVIRLEEIEGLALSLSWTISRQSKIEDNGHFYEKVEATDAGGAAMIVYFNVDIPTNIEKAKK